MPKSLAATEPIVSIGDLLKSLGDVPPERVRLVPTPGTATEKHVVAIDAHEDRLCELVDGILVEKPMGAWESLLAVLLVRRIGAYVDEHDLGVVLGEAGMLRLRPRLVRIPDVSFISWERMPGEVFPTKPIPDLVPDLAVEVLSVSNTKGEMERKLGEFFDAGTRLVWLVDPRTRTIDAYTSETEFRRFRRSQTLDGGDVLPGFRLSLREFFTPPARLRKRRKW